MIQSRLIYPRSKNREHKIDQMSLFHAKSTFGFLYVTRKQQNFCDEEKRELNKWYPQVFYGTFFSFLSVSLYFARLSYAEILQLKIGNSLHFSHFFWYIEVSVPFGNNFDLYTEMHFIYSYVNVVREIKISTSSFSALCRKIF